jgi:uncharacterized protein (TIGR03437 family)
MTPGTYVNFDNGNGVGFTPIGDIGFDGTKVTFLGKAKGGVLPFTGAALFYEQIDLATLESLAPLASAYPIPANMMPVGSILGIRTNRGNATKLLVTAISSSSLTFRYQTYIVATPTITSVANHYSYIPNGFPNSGIAPSSIFAIFGNNMAQPQTGGATLQSSAGPVGLPKSLNGASLSVMAGSQTFTPAMYYATPTALAAVLPAGVPTGTAVLTVAYNGNISNQFQLQVVASAPGLASYSYYGTGGGLITATDPVSGGLIHYTNAAPRGKTIVLWGTGLGSDPQDSDAVFATTPNPVNQSSVQIYFGGVAGMILYAGSSGYPGLNQINVTVPPNAPTGCSVPVVAAVGGVASNFLTIPIVTSAGNKCTDAAYGVSGDLLNTLTGKTNVKAGSLLVAQAVMPGTSGVPQSTNFASASFTSVSGAAYGGSTAFVSIGGCIVTQTASGAAADTLAGLAAGPSIGLAGLAGSYTLMPTMTKGSYNAGLPTGAIPSTGGSFTFTGPGGADVGAFTTTLNFPTPPLSWTNQSATATIDRMKGLEVAWTGGAAGSFVQVSGSSTSAGGATGRFTCYAPQADLRFVVPPYVSGALPVGTGTVALADYSWAASSAPPKGLDDLIAAAVQLIQTSSIYH